MAKSRVQRNLEAIRRINAFKYKSRCTQSPVNKWEKEMPKEMQTIIISDDEDDDEEEWLHARQPVASSGTPCRSSISRSKALRGRATRRIIEDEEEEIETHTTQRITHRSQESQQSKNKTSIQIVINQNVLKDVAPSIELSFQSLTEILNFLNDHKLQVRELQNNSEFLKLFELCKNVIQYLPNNSSNDLINQMGELMFFRKGRTKLMLVREITSMESDRYASFNSKVFAFLKEKGSAVPMMGAVSGWTSVAKPQVTLLDNSLWTNLVLDFHQIYNHYVRRSARDATAGRTGMFFACHVEPRLMLYYACQKIQRLLSCSLPQALRSLETLKGQHHEEVEIFISDNPCGTCRKFKEKIEDLTGLRFVIKSCKNLAEIGRVLRYNDRHRQFPTKAVDPFQVKSKFEVVIRSKSVKELERGLVTVREETVEEERWSASVVVGEQRRGKRRKYSMLDSDDEEEYEPSKKRQSKNRKRGLLSPRKTPQKKIASRPSQSPFVGSTGRRLEFAK
ncbi:hypothetical protein F5884DRAFT_299810 [Xylogone sp. PMI_703]|nr:hypothetical protein F5884DRAFT_299810 [Xylogone sp. PMI_703]